MLGKTFKGLTDKMLEVADGAVPGTGDAPGRACGLRATRAGGGDRLRRDPGHRTRYPGGMALRFARVKGYRDDKTAEEADTVDTLRAMFEQQGG